MDSLFLQLQRRSLFVKKTLKGRLNEYDLSISDCYAKLSDEELVAVVINIIDQNPNCGYRRMLGFMMSRGIRVAEKRTRESMHRVDPEGVQLCAMQLTVIHRRVYKVPGILSLWQIDGHNKLIKYMSF